MPHKTTRRQALIAGAAGAGLFFEGAGEHKTPMHGHPAPMKPYNAT